MCKNEYIYTLLSINYLQPFETKSEILNNFATYMEYNYSLINNQYE